MPLFLIHLFYTTVLKFDIVFLVEVNFFLKLHWKKIDLLFIQITTSTLTSIMRKKVTSGVNCLNGNKGHKVTLITRTWHYSTNKKSTGKVNNMIVLWTFSTKRIKLFFFNVFSVVLSVQEMLASMRFPSNFIDETGKRPKWEDKHEHTVVMQSGDARKGKLRNYQRALTAFDAEPSEKALRGNWFEWNNELKAIL